MAESAQIREYEDGEIVPGTPYRVARMLGAGGMGCVYEVEHVELGRSFVLKSLLKSLADRDDLILRMRNEWRALGRLSHENIVDVVNAGMSATGAPYYVMELLVGETLSQRMRRLSRLPYDEAARIAREILLGLEAAHRIDVVHRDIKPANVFVTRDEVVKVLDFGIAKVRDDSITQTTAHGLAIGTPRYMSPEQVAGSETSAQSDLYAVGLLLFEMIAGQGPFDDVRGQSERMLAHVSRKPPALSAHAEVPGELSALVDRALAKLPADRPGSAEEMAEALVPFAGPRRPGAWASSWAIREEGTGRRLVVSTPKVQIDSEEATLAMPVPIPQSAWPSSRRGTVPEPASPEPVHAEASTPRLPTEHLVAPLDSEALRDASTRTSVRSLPKDLAALATPPPVQTQAPIRPVSASTVPRRWKLAAGALILAAGAGLAFTWPAGSGEVASPRESSSEAKSAVLPSPAPATDAVAAWAPDDDADAGASEAERVADEDAGAATPSESAGLNVVDAPPVPSAPADSPRKKPRPRAPSKAPRPSKSLPGSGL